MINKKLCLLLTCLISMAAFAQDSILIRAYYIAQYRFTEENKKIKTEETTLDIGRNMSDFYSRWDAVRTHLVDSMAARGMSLAAILSARAKYPPASLRYHVYKNYPQKGLLLYTDRNVKSFHYEESMPKQVWKIEKKDTVILDYKCHAASCDFRGRHWNVFYTNDIPIANGPWKLGGLPGLILYAKDESGIFKFDCIGIKNGHGERITLPNLKKSIKTTRPKYMELCRESKRDFVGFMAKMIGHNYGPGYGPDGKELKYPPKTALFLDY